MPCPHLEYRAVGDGRAFDVARAYCTVTDTFVQPMRADVCTDRYALHHADHCEIYLAADATADDTVGDEVEP
jgi:hypothetical protein